MPEETSSVPSCVFTAARGSRFLGNFLEMGQEMSQASCFASVTSSLAGLKVRCKSPIRGPDNLVSKMDSLSKPSWWAASLSFK